MSAPLMPSPLDYVGRRRFAFYPPIAHVDPNEWLLGVGDRSEVQVVNAQTGREIWVSRQYIGAVSETSSPLLIVGLTKALDFRGGTVEPRVKQIIEMPAAAGMGKDATHRPSAPASVIEIRLESRADSALNRAMLATCICAIVLALLAALVTTAIRF